MYKRIKIILNYYNPEQDEKLINNNLTKHSNYTLINIEFIKNTTYSTSYAILHLITK